MLAEHPTVDTSQAALAAARAIAPRFSARARESEQLRTLPPDLVADARGAGLFRLATPRSLGGAELPPAVIVEIIEELCRADGSAGWTVLIGNGTAFLAWLDPAAATGLLGGRTDVVSACVFAPTGRLVPDGADQLRLGGSWAMSSGCLHSDLFINGAMLFDGDQPRLLPGRGPDWRLAVFPATSGSVVDSWDAAGLRGTGSHDVVAGSVLVPERHTMAAFFEPARHDGPLWRFPFFTLVGTFLVGFPLGVARRALDELAGFAPTKFRPPGPGPIADDGDLQTALTRAEGGLQAARALVFDTIGAMWDSARAGDVPTVEQRARFLLAAQQAMRASIEAVDTVVGFAGVGAMHADHPVQRCFRDIHAAAQHIYFSAAATKRYAKVRLGIEQPTFWF
ncbi:MAG: indole-3-acetate monooxygenase [Pseudonocardiales bacterium]|nr:indole-3-acetate monooxygenase [Pseudonocardiales bacterium]